MVQAKMQCTSVTGGKDAGYESVTLHAVYSSDPNDPNYSYSQATPSASAQMQINNPAALGKFEQGKLYFVDFTPAE